MRREKLWRREAGLRSDMKRNSLEVLGGEQEMRRFDKLRRSEEW